MKTEKTTARVSKQKELIVERLSVDYKKVKHLLKNSLMICNYDKSSGKTNKGLKYYKDLEEKIDYILLQMDKELSKVIYNEFFTTKVDNWWIYYYSKSTYYRLRHKAVDAFLGWWYA